MCAGMSTGRGCITCCQQAHSAGIGVVVNEIKACDCGTNGACQSQCATEYCANGTVAAGSDPCDMCLASSLGTVDGGATGPCYNQVNSACMGNADCAAYMACANPCNNLP
jgi:hypothetical protein